MLFRGTVKKYNWYEGKIFPKYGGISFTYGIFSPNTRKLWWTFLFEVLHFTVFFRAIGLTKLFYLIFR